MRRCESAASAPSVGTREHDCGVQADNEDANGDGMDEGDSGQRKQRNHADLHAQAGALEARDDLNKFIAVRVKQKKSGDNNN